MVICVHDIVHLYPIILTCVIRNFWLQNQLEQARYAHVPLGNIPSDPALFVSDVFYSRHLLRHNHVLWASPTDKPDLGGTENLLWSMIILFEHAFSEIVYMTKREREGEREKKEKKFIFGFISGREDDDHRLITDAEEGRSLEINNPGAYPTCCIELSLDGLAVNTVLQSAHINDYEGASGTSISFDWAPQVP